LKLAEGFLSLVDFMPDDLWLDSDTSVREPRYTASGVSHGDNASHPPAYWPNTDGKAEPEVSRALRLVYDSLNDTITPSLNSNHR